jgi:hypothetical protein
MHSAIGPAPGFADAHWVDFHVFFEQSVMGTGIRLVRMSETDRFLPILGIADEKICPPEEMRLEPAGSDDKNITAKGRHIGP